MKKFFICILFQLIIANSACATITCYFTYESEKFETTFRVNAGTETDPDALMFEQIKNGMPYILGLERIIKKSTPHFNVFIDCVSGGQSFLSVDGTSESVEFSCDHSTLVETIGQMGNSLNIETINPIFELTCYALQIAYIPEKINPHPEEERWHRILENKENISIVGFVCDPYLAPVYTHTYKNGSHAIRYGLFSHYSKALKAIEYLKLNKNHVQIVPVNLKIEDMKEFISKGGF